jgi:hypothetical protein
VVLEIDLNGGRQHLIPAGCSSWSPARSSPISTGSLRHPTATSAPWARRSMKLPCMRIIM